MGTPRWGDDVEPGTLPDKVNAASVKSWLFNKDTVDKVRQHLMEHGHKVADGDRLAKTIIFARMRGWRYRISRFPAWSWSESGATAPHTGFKAEVYVLTKEEGGRHTPFIKRRNTRRVTGFLDAARGRSPPSPAKSRRMCEVPEPL